jgi:hypothetical protein
VGGNSGCWPNRWRKSLYLPHDELDEHMTLTLLLHQERDEAILEILQKYTTKLADRSTHLLG